DVRLGGSVGPPALERIEVAGHPENSVAEAAVTFAGGAVARQHARRCRGRTGGGDLRFDRRHQFVEADPLPCRRHSVTLRRSIAAHPTRLSAALVRTSLSYKQGSGWTDLAPMASSATSFHKRERS